MVGGFPHIIHCRKCSVEERKVERCRELKTRQVRLSVTQEMFQFRLSSRS